MQRLALGLRVHCGTCVATKWWSEVVVHQLSGHIWECNQQPAGMMTRLATGYCHFGQQLPASDSAIHSEGRAPATRR
jgi:hypothetical protein